MKHHFALSLAVLVFLAMLTHTSVGQETDDPFSTSTPVAKESTQPKREKVIVHIPTLYLSFRWRDLNSGLVQIQRDVSRVKKEIDSLSPDSSKDQVAKLEKQLLSLTSTYESAKQELDRIPYDTTFDLERWEQFKEQLRQNRMAEAERQAVDDHVKRENKRLRDENVELRVEIERLKNGR